MRTESSFEIEVPAKWVLTGEHSVLRGREAIAFPYPKFNLTLSYHTSELHRVTATPFRSHLRALLGRASEFLNVRLEMDETLIDVHSQIPVGAGLGSSAALSVAVARLCLWKTGQDDSRLVPLATYLEDFFHGKSSGMDVCAISSSQPILYSMKSGIQTLPLSGKVPRFELYDSGKRGQTKECIQKVKHWQQTTPHLVEHFDEQMQEATRLAYRSLLDFPAQPKEAEERLAVAMNSAQQCFENWGLVTPELLEQKYELLKQGALAVKLTGAGLGGFWVALWRS